MPYNILNGAIRWRMHDFLCDVNSNICSNSYRLRDVRKKCQNVDLENEGLEKRDLCHSTRNVRTHTGDFFQNIGNLATYIYAKGHAHTHKHVLMQRQRETGVITIGKICIKMCLKARADCLANLSMR